MAFYSQDDFVPDASVGYLVRRIHQASVAALEPVFAEEGVTGVQWSALTSIWFERGTTCAELARDLSHDKGAMTRLIDVLEERGLVVRTRDTADRRVVNLALTDEGQAVARRCRSRVIACWNDWLGDWDERDAQRLVASLQRLRATFEGAGSASCG